MKNGKGLIWFKCFNQQLKGICSSGENDSSRKMTKEYIETFFKKKRFTVFACKHAH